MGRINNVIDNNIVYDFIYLEYETEKEIEYKKIKFFDFNNFVFLKNNRFIFRNLISKKLISKKLNLSKKCINIVYF